MADSRAVEQLWYGKDYASAFARTLLTPASLVYGGVVGTRDALYDVGWLRVHRAPISVVSVGNLTVGGTGKTPVAAWIARGLAARGAHPAIVLRGYGDDAVDRVHDRLATVAPMVPRVSVRIVPLDLVNTIDRSETRSLSSLAGIRVGVVVSIGDPAAFMSQVSGLGPRFNTKVDARLFPDHHAFTDREVAEVARDLRHVAMVLCTLKDAVKLGARWPRLGPPLWYVSQDVQVERGVGGLDFVLDGVVRTRTPRTPSQIAG